MGKLFYKIKQLAEGVMLNLHGNVLTVKHDAVLIVIHIRGILETPIAAVDGHRNDPVILSRRMIDAPRITLVLPAQKTFRIPALLCILSRRDRLGILLGLGEVNGDIQIAVLCR